MSSEDENVVRLLNAGESVRRRLVPLRQLAETCRILLDLDARMETSLVLVFCVVAGEGRPLSGVEVRNFAGLSRSAVSRHLQTLSASPVAGTATRTAGLGLVKSTENPFDARSLLYTLTPAGERLAQRLADILDRDDRPRSP